MTGNDLFEEYCNEYPLVQGYREVSYESWLQQQVVDYRNEVADNHMTQHHKDLEECVIKLLTSIDNGKISQRAIIGLRILTNM